MCVRACMRAFVCACVRFVIDVVVAVVPVWLVWP